MEKVQAATVYVDIWVKIGNRMVMLPISRFERQGFVPIYVCSKCDLLTSGVSL